MLTACTVCPAVGKITYSYGGEPTAAHATINGDPMITGFDGRSFEFMGEPGSFYSLISEQRHQVRRHTCMQLRKPRSLPVLQSVTT